MGRVKFAVKEIRYKSKMEVDTPTIPVGDVTANDFEEYEEVEGITDCKGDEEMSTTGGNDEIPRCRFCWMSHAD